MIQVQDVRVAIDGVEILHGVSFEIAAGSVGRRAASLAESCLFVARSSFRVAQACFVWSLHGLLV